MLVFIRSKTCVCPVKRECPEGFSWKRDRLKLSVSGDGMPSVRCRAKRKGTGTESGSLSRNILRRSLCGFSRSVRNHNYLPGKAVGKASVCRLAVVVEVPQTYR